LHKLICDKDLRIKLASQGLNYVRGNDIQKVVADIVNRTTTVRCPRVSDYKELSINRIQWGAEELVELHTFDKMVEREPWFQQW
jgi:hypothetical protein